VLLTRTTFNLSSFTGLIMVIGIVAKNGILLLDADQRFRAEGLSPENSMIQAGERRLRPIVMTALANGRGHDSARTRLGHGFTNAAAVGDRRDRRDSGVDGAVAGDYPRGALLHGGLRTCAIAAVHSAPMT
jgi:hypothetical protein